MLNLLAKLQGYKTYIAAAGLLGLAAFQASTGDYAGAMQSALAAATAAGLRSAINNLPTPAPPVK